MTGGPLSVFDECRGDLYKEKYSSKWFICLGIVLPRKISLISGCSVKITPDINPIYVGIERSFPDDSKNVSFVDMGLEYMIL